MTVKNFYLYDDVESTAIDVPNNLANDPQLSSEWVQTFYLPYRTSGLEAAAKDPEHPLSFLPDWAARGAYRLAQSANIVQTQIGMDEETNAKDIQDYQKHLEKVPYDKPVLDALLKMSDADSIGEFWDAAATSDGLRAIGNVVGESITQFLPVIAATIAAIPLTAGQSVTAGSVILGSISGLGSMGIEYGAAALSAMNDYLQEQGTNARDDKAVAAVLGNEEKMGEFTEFALKRGIPIGVIDGLSMGFAGKITGALRKARKNAEKAVKTTKVKTPTTETITEIGPKVPSRVPELTALAVEAGVMQPALGGLGEAVAQQVSGEGFKLGEVALEMIAEIPGGTAEIGIGLALEGRRERKEAEVEALKEKNLIFQKKKEEMLRQRKGKEEIEMVSADLEREGINSETGRPDSEQYEWTAFNALDVPVKAGGKAFDRDSIKLWFKGEIKQPKSKRIIMDYFTRKGYIEKVKGQYVWTAVAEQRAKEIEAGGIQPELFTEEEVTVTEPTRDLEAEVEEARPVVDTELEPEITSRIDAAMGDRPVINHNVIELIDIIRTNIGEEQANQAQAYAEAKMEIAIEQRQEEQTTPEAPTPEAPTPVEEKIKVHSRTQDGTIIDYLYKGYIIEKAIDSDDKPTGIWHLFDYNTTPKEYELSGKQLRPFESADTRADLIKIVDKITEATPTPEAPVIEEDTAQLEFNLEAPEITEVLPQEDPVQLDLDLDLEPVAENLSNQEREFINETMSPRLRTDIRPFKLRREGADRDALDKEFEANLDMIRTAQIHSASGLKKQPMSVEEQEYLQNAFADESEFIDNIISDSIIATNDEQRDALKEKNSKLIDNLTGEQIAGSVWESAYNVWHTTRLAEKFRSYRNFARSIIARREARERYNNIGMVIAAPLYEDISATESKELGRMAAVLDALYSTYENGAILTDIQGPKQNVFFENGTIRIVIPKEVPNKEFTEVNPSTKSVTVTKEPVMKPERYQALLKELGVTPGETYRLDARLTEKYKTGQEAFKKMFDLNMVAFMNFMLQGTPLHEGIIRNYNDTVKTLEKKVFQSIHEYIKDINKVLPEDQRIPEDVKVGTDTVFVKGSKDATKTTLENITGRIPKDDQNAKNIIQTLRNQVQVLKIVNDQQQILREHPYYLPRLRYGSFFFTVRDRDTKELVGYYTDTPNAVDRTNKSKEKNLKKIREEVKNLYPESTYEISEIEPRRTDKTSGLDSATLDKVKRLGSSIGYRTYNKETPEGKFFKDIDTELEKVGFGKFLAQRDEDIISGYYTSDNRDNYLPIVLSNYVRSAADTASNLDYIRPIKASIEILEEGMKDETGKKVVKPQPKLADLARETDKHIKEPNEPGALLKTFAFHYALGGNFSSAFVNLSQSFVTTMPVLGMIIKDGKASVEVPRALKDAQKLFKMPIGKEIGRLSTYGFDFSNPNPPKHLTRDEWNMLRKMYEEGTIQAIVNLDLGAKLQQDLGSTLKGRVNDKTAKRLAKLSEASSFMFGSVEQINRIAAALATYRLAVKSDKNLKRFQKFSESTLFAEEKMTPERAARMMVYKTQFLIGKENRPQLFRSAIGNVSTQFLSFVQQYIGLFAQTLNMMMGKDAESRRMGGVILGSLVLSMWFFAGFMGMPYLENLRQLLRLASKTAFDYEFDLEYGMKEALNGVLNPYFTDAIMHGGFSRLTGIDLRRRVGVGEPIPFNLMQGNLMAASGPAGSLLVDSLARIKKGISLRDPMMVMTSVLPLGPRAFLESWRGGILDTPIRTTQGKVLMPGEDLNWTDRFKQGMGFTPMKVSEEREDKRILRYLNTRARPIQDFYLTQLAEKMAERRKERSVSLRRELMQEINEIRKEINEKNKEALAEGRRDKLIRITPRAVRERMRVNLGGQLDPLIKSARKRIGGIKRGRETLEDYNPRSTNLWDVLVED